MRRKNPGPGSPAHDPVFYLVLSASPGFKNDGTIGPAVDLLVFMPDLFLDESGDIRVEPYLDGDWRPLVDPKAGSMNSSKLKSPGISNCFPVGRSVLMRFRAKVLTSFRT